LFGPQLLSNQIKSNQTNKGGGSVLKIIRGFKTNEIKCKVGLRNENTNKINPSGCKSYVWDTIINDNNTKFNVNNVNNTFINNGEFSRTTFKDKERGYVIGTIREPCSQYVSLWSFGSLNHGQFRNQFEQDTNQVEAEELYGTSPPYFNTTNDIQRFYKWMNHSLVIGEIGRRVNVSYGSNNDDSNDDDDDDDSNSDSIVNNVDCWVVVENFQQTLLDCLVKYENQGGYVDWTSETVSQLKDEVVLEEETSRLEMEEEEKQKQIEVNSHHHRHHGLRGRRELRYYTVTKDDPLGDPRSKHHASCGVFFATDAQNSDTNKNTNSNLLQQQVMSPDNESFIYKQFGYNGCCNPGTNYLGSPSTFTTTGTPTGRTSSSSSTASESVTSTSTSSSLTTLASPLQHHHQEQRQQYHQQQQQHQSPDFGSVHIKSIEASKVWNKVPLVTTSSSSSSSSFDSNNTGCTGGGGSSPATSMDPSFPSSSILKLHDDTTTSSIISISLLLLAVGGFFVRVYRCFIYKKRRTLLLTTNSK
jgi:hypothetical protein